MGGARNRGRSKKQGQHWIKEEQGIGTGSSGCGRSRLQESQLGAEQGKSVCLAEERQQLLGARNRDNIMVGGRVRNKVAMVGGGTRTGKEWLWEEQGKWQKGRGNSKELGSIVGGARRKSRK